jgi:hypothetical protein
MKNREDEEEKRNISIEGTKSNRCGLQMFTFKGDYNRPAKTKKKIDV